MRFMCWIIVFVGAMALATQTKLSLAGEISMKTTQFNLSFAANGQPLSLKRTSDGAELLNAANPGQGFYLKGKGEGLRLDNISFESGRLTLRAPDQLPAVTFTVRETEKYIAFHIERIEAVPTNQDITLHFEMKVKPEVRVMALDYMTGVQNFDNSVVVNWSYIGHRHPSNPLGGFALYAKASDDDEDDTILKIWTGEQLPHPVVKGDWDLKTAREWVKNWQKTFYDPSQMYLEGKNVEELRQAADYAQKAGVRQVFLFTHVWREDPFWPYKKENCYVNRNVFPKGEEDLRDFSDYLYKKGMLLTLHYVSGGIGPFDPKYIGSKPDRRLASWGGGTIAQPSNDTTTTLLFKPNPGVEMPSQLPQSAYMRFGTRPPMLDFYHGYHFVRVEDEIVQVGAFENTDKPVWTLSGCQRGMFDTNPAVHQTGADAAGLIDSYWQNFMPDNDSTLLEEMAETYAGLLNRCHIWNVMYDGGEIHRYNGEWGYEKFTSLVYSHLDHPVIGMSSGGVPSPCQLEYHLNSTRKRQGYVYMNNSGLMLEHPSREATTYLGAEFEMSMTCAKNSRLYGVWKPEPMFAISLHDLQTHGQTERIMKTAKDWKEIDRIIDDKTRAELMSTFRTNTEPQAAPNHWPISDFVHVPREKKDCWELVPTTIMTRGKTDIHWQNGQEFGTIVPRQNVQAGQEMKLANPFKSQPPRAIIRNFSAFHSPDAPSAQQSASGDGAVKERKSDWAFDYEKDMAANQGEGEATFENIPLQPKASIIQNLRDTRIEQEGDALIFSISNPLAQAVWEEDKLPTWPCKNNLLNHRGIGMWITGDKSGAILVFEIPGGDYAVPIDFEGRRYVEVPNAQVAWTSSYWGWRMGAKRTEYKNVQQMKLGFGMVPAQTNVRVKVEGLTALREIPVALTDPIIRLGEGNVQITGSLANSEYMVYDGGTKAQIFDRNWKHLRDLSAKPDKWVASEGESVVSVDSPHPGPKPWLEVQMLVEGTPILVPKK